MHLKSKHILDMVMFDIIRLKSMCSSNTMFSFLDNMGLGGGGHFIGNLNDGG